MWLLCSAGLAGQDTLRIIDPEGEPIPFVYLYTLPDSVALGTTDIDGKFALPPHAANNEVIVLSALIYVDQRTTYRNLARDGFVYRMEPEALVMQTLTVVGRRNETPSEINQQIETISRKEIDRAQTLTTADALADLGGVYVQKSQFGGGSPVIRGFEANRVLLVVDGVRMNNAIYRNGHLQNAITVDPLALDRMEVLYGAGALAYGSDALGGVVHFRTKQPVYRPSCFANTEGQVNLSYSSAANAVTLSGRLEYGGNDWAGLTLLSTTSTSHLRAGAQRPARFPNFGRRAVFAERRNGEDVLVDNPDPNFQVGTAYDQYNLLQKFRFRLRDKLELSANFQFSTTSNVPRYDALTEPLLLGRPELRWARWDYGPQTRALAALTLSDRRATKLYDVATYLLSYQFVEEDRISRRFGDRLEENNLEDVGAWNLQTDFAKEINPFLTLRYGLDLRYDAVASTAFNRHVDTGARTSDLATRYPSGGSWLAAGGAYAEARYELSPGWALRGGLRLSRQRLGATFGPDDPVEWPRAYLDGIENTESAAVASLGLRGKHLRLLYAQGFRAPNIDDFAKFRERNGFIQVPNPALQPERSHTLEAGYRTDGQKFTAEVTAYHTWLRNAIVRRDGTLPDGSATFVSNGDTLRAQTNVNAESARIYGADFVLHYRPSPAWTIRTDAHWLRGRRRQETPLGIQTLPQDHIPPAYGSTTVEWSSSARNNRSAWTLGFRFRYQLAKPVDDYAVSEIFLAPNGPILNRFGTSDNLERTPLAPESLQFTGTYGWWTANLYAEYTPSPAWAFRLRANNLLDRHYRTFASGVSAPGIDVSAGVTWSF